MDTEQETSGQVASEELQLKQQAACEDCLQTSLKLTLEHFEALGVLAAAGMKATYLACERGKLSGDSGRVPIAGAVVTLLKDGSLQVSADGCNGRIPPATAETPGYPTDHGETGAVRAMEDFGNVDWGASVFATTLSPCIMCTRTIEFLYRLGLRSVVIAEATSFQGAEGRLDNLEGLNIVRLTEPQTTIRMQNFARRYPWDWAADIGEVPPRERQHKLIVDRARSEGEQWWKALKEGQACVFTADSDKPLSHSEDRRRVSGGNPCQAAVLCAMGEAGSAVNLRECAVVWRSADTATIKAFGETSLGACELFRPAVLVTQGPVSQSLAEPLRAVGVQIVELCEGESQSPTFHAGSFEAPARKVGRRGNDR